MNDLLLALQNLALPSLIRESDALFPVCETVHVFALACVIGSIAMVDLRLLGLWARQDRITTLAAEMLPWTWAGFGLAALTGGLMFASSAVRYAANDEFRIKLVLLLLAGVNMLFFQLRTARSVADWDEWDDKRRPPTAAKAAAALSLLLWLSIVTAGRWIGFTLK